MYDFVVKLNIIILLKFEITTLIKIISYRLTASNIYDIPWIGLWLSIIILRVGVNTDRFYLKKGVPYLIGHTVSRFSHVIWSFSGLW